MAQVLEFDSQYFDSVKVVVNMWTQKTDIIPEKIVYRVMSSARRKIMRELKNKKSSGHFYQKAQISVEPKEVEVHWIIK